MGRFTEQLNQGILEGEANKNPKEYHRYPHQTYLTALEWRNVEMTKEQGEFLSSGRSLLRYPYFRQIGGLWRIIYRSFAEARKHESLRTVVFSEYTTMNLFIGIFTTLEFGFKGIFSSLIFAFLPYENSSSMQASFAEYFKNYSTNLETIPFYNHNHKGYLTSLNQAYSTSADKTWTDWFSLKLLALDLWAKRLISKPLAYMFNEDEVNTVPAKTEVLVKCPIHAEDDEQAKEFFRKKLNAVDIHFIGSSSNSLVSIADSENIQVKAPHQSKPKDGRESQFKEYRTVYARLNTPRYRDFVKVVPVLAQEEISISKIAGQNFVQVKCTVNTENGEGGPDSATDATLNEKISTLKKVEGATSLYDYGDSFNPNRKSCFFAVPVAQLNNYLNNVREEVDNVDVFIHNF